MVRNPRRQLWSSPGRHLASSAGQATRTAGQGHSHRTVNSRPDLTGGDWRSWHDERSAERALEAAVEDPCESKSYALLNGEREDLEAPAQLRDGVVFVPLHFLALATGTRVVWAADTRTVTMQVPS